MSYLPQMGGWWPMPSFVPPGHHPPPASQGQPGNFPPSLSNTGSFDSLPTAMVEAAPATDFDGGGLSPLQRRIAWSPFWAAVSEEPFALASTLRYAYAGPHCEFSGDYERLCADLVTAGYERPEASRCVKEMLLEKLLVHLEAPNSPCRLPPRFRTDLDRHQAALADGRMPYADFRRRMCRSADGLVTRLKPPISSARHDEIKRSLAQWGLGSLAAGAPPEITGDHERFDSKALAMASVLDRSCKSYRGRSPKTIAGAMAHVVGKMLRGHQTGTDVDHQLRSIRGSVWLCDHVMPAVLEANGLSREEVEAVRRVYVAKVGGVLDGWRWEADHVGDFKPAPPKALATHWQGMLLEMRQEPDGGTRMAETTDAWVPPELPVLLQQALAGAKFSSRRQKVEHAEKLRGDWRLAFERFVSVFAIEGEARHVTLRRGAAAIDAVIDREVAKLHGGQHVA